MNARLILLLFIITSCSGRYSPNTTQEIVINSENEIKISGSLEYVGSSKLAIIIAGSGPTDRDGNNPQGLKSNAYKQLSEAFALYGISTFRYDKRGIGKSSKVEEFDATFFSFVNDLDSIITHFKSDFKEINLVGHSEGALIATLSAQNNPNVTSLSLLAGTGKRFDEILLDQLEKFPKLVPLAEIHIEEIKAKKELSEVNPLLGNLFRPSIVPYMESVFTLEPKLELAKVGQPILIIGGKCDMQVPIEHSELLHEGNPNATLVQINDMGHVLKHIGDDCYGAKEVYSNPDIELNPKLVQVLTDFIE